MAEKDKFKYYAVLGGKARKKLNHIITLELVATR